MAKNFVIYRALCRQMELEKKINLSTMFMWDWMIVCLFKDGISIVNLTGLRFSGFSSFGDLFVGR